MTSSRERAPAPWLHAAFTVAIASALRCSTPVPPPVERKPATGAVAVAAPTGSGNRLSPNASREIDPVLVRAIRSSTVTKTARVTLIAAGEAEQHALERDDRIAGYPIRGPVRELSHDESARLAAVLIDATNYDWDARIRCKNEQMVGVRFSGSDGAELAVGLPCSQAIWAYRRAGGTGFMGAVLSREALTTLLATVDSATRVEHDRKHE